MAWCNRLRRLANRYPARRSAPAKELVLGRASGGQAQQTPVVSFSWKFRPWWDPHQSDPMPQASRDGVMPSTRPSSSRASVGAPGGTVIETGRAIVRKDRIV